MFSREARLTILGLLTFTFLSSPVVAFVDYFDDFEDDQTGAPPTSDFYTSNTGVVTTSTALGTKAWGLQTTGSLVGNAGVELCNSVAGPETGTFVDFAIRFGGMPGSDASKFASVTLTGTGDSYNLRFYGDGSMQLLLGAAAVTLPGTFTSGTWYNVTYGGFDCGEDKFCVGISELVTSACIDDVGGSSSIDTFSFIDSFSPSVANVRIDDVSWTHWQDPPPTAVGALATAAVTDLTGFDVDPTGTGLLARVDGGDDVQAYAPNTLTPLGGLRNVDCNGVGNQNEDMVAASDIGLVYIVCDSGSNNPAFFSIRSLSNGQLTFDDPDCDPDGFDSECVDDIDLRGGSDCADGADDFPDDLDLRELGDIASVPLDYSYITNNEFGFNADRAVAFAYSADNGFIGVMQYTAIAGVDDRCRTARANFAGSQAEQIAVWQPNIDSEVVYFAAVDTGSQSKLYHYTPLDDACGGQCLQGTLVEAGSVGGTSGGTAISCDDFYCLVATTAASDNLRLINLVSGATVWSKTVGELDRGVALSVRGGLGVNPDGDADDFAVYLDGTSLTSYTAYIVWASNGTAFGSIAAPTGTFVDLRLKDDGSLAWIATDDVIAVYDIRAAFPDIIPTGCENPPCDEPGDEPGDGSVLFPVSGLVDSGTFTNAGLANMFMGVLMIAGMTVTIGFSPQALTGGRAEFSARLFLVLGVIGAILGFVLAIAFGLFSTAVWVSMVVLAAIAIGVKVWLSRANGGG